MNNTFLPKGFKNITWLEEKLKKQSEEWWIQRGEAQALKLFHEMSFRVPAYKDFLRKNRIEPDKIRTINDFKNIPTIDKNNYLRAYPLEQLTWDGEFNTKQWTISTTSGSTGEPFYFPRQKAQSWQYAIMAELYLRANFQIDKKKTLYIVGFPMGAWIGGLFTYQALELLAEKGNYSLSIITPGIHKKEIIKAVKTFGSKFDQILIGSYGPFLKDVLDDGEKMGLSWERYNLGFIFSAEGFTEEFRDYVIKKIGSEDRLYSCTLNHYGTVDLGTMSYETPIAILARRLALNNNALYKNLFGSTSRLPTLTQYIPELFFFENLSGRLLCSAYSGLPLVRYDLKDKGGLISFKEIKKRNIENGINFNKEIIKAKIENIVWQLPFVYVYERSDFSVSFYAFNIYPETIKRALQNIELEKDLTGKFTMVVKSDKFQNPVLYINVEMKAGLRKNKRIERYVKDRVKKQLIKESSEYRETYQEKKDLAAPKIVLWEYENPIFFKPGIKQKWVQ